MKHDQDKPNFSLVPMQILTDIARVREFGLKKYKDPNNWKNVSIDRYTSAAMRHLIAFIEDPDSTDLESGLSHMSHVACNVAFICALLDQNKPQPDKPQPLDLLKEVHALRPDNLINKPYEVGLFNGLEVALSIFEDRQPDFRTLDTTTPVD